MVRLSYPVQLLLSGAGYFAAGWLSLEAFALINASASPVWPPTGIAIGLLLIGGYRLWPAFFVGAFAFNFMVGGDIASSLAIGAGNTLEGLTGAWIANRFCNGRAVFDKAPKTLIFGVGMAFPAAISASIGVGALVLGGLAPRELAGAIWQTWWLGDLAGALVFTPLIVLWARAEKVDKEEFALYGAAVTLGLLRFWGLPQGILLLLPLLVAWAAIRHGPRVMAGLTVIVAGFAVLNAMLGRGIFVGIDGNQSLLELQVFLAFFSATTLVLAAGSVERRGNNSAAWGRAPVVILAFIPLLLGAILTGNVVRPAYDELGATQGEDHLEAKVDQWIGAMESNEAWLASTKTMMETHEMNRSMFHHFVESSGWLQKFGGIQAITYNRYVEPSELAAFQDSLNADSSLAALGYPTLVASAGTIIDYVVPIAGNEVAFGLDLSKEPIRNTALESARLSGKITVTAPITLVQETGETQAILILMPVYHGPSDTEAQRMANFVGVIVSVHRGEDLAIFLGVQGTIVDVTGEPIPLIGGTASGAMAEFQFGTRTYHVQAAAATPTSDIAKWASTFVVAAGGLLSLAATMAVYAYDSTQRRAEAQATLMNQRLVETQEVARIGSWEWDIPADNITWSKQLFELFGQDSESFDTSFEGYISCIHPEDREALQGVVYKAFETGESFSTDHRVVWPDGTVRWIHGLGYVQMGTEGPTRMMGTAQDVTDRIEAEANRRHVDAQSQELDNLKRVDDFKTQFLNTAAHELRTPLSPIMIQLKLLERTVEGTAGAENLEVLSRNIKRLSDLIDDFLISSQFQAGRLAISPAEGDFHQCAANVHQSFIGVADEKGISLKYRQEGESNFVFDQQRITQVLYNLLSNAMKFTPEGGTIQLESRVDANYAYMTVKDSGQGMSEEGIGKLFEAFSQVHDPMSITERGSGLGLYICKAIAEGHGGTITAVSAGAGKGSTFTLQLPTPP